MTIIKGWHFTEFLNDDDHDEERLPTVFVPYGPGVMLTVQMGEPVPDSLSNDPTPLH